MAGSGSASVRIDGLRRLRRDLRQLEGGLADLKDANARAGQVVVQAATAKAPRRPGSGRLAGSGRASRAAGRVSVLWGGARVPYAGPIHWGWPARGIEAQPFVAEAAQETEPKWLPAYLADIDAALAPMYGRTY